MSVAPEKEVGTDPVRYPEGGGRGTRQKFISARDAVEPGGRPRVADLIGMVLGVVLGWDARDAP